MPLNVLITAASRRVGLVTAFQQALRAAGERGRVIVTDVNPLSPAVHVADRAYLVPLCGDPGYLDEVLAICESEGVGLVIPTIDDELELFGEARDRFLARGIRVAVSDAATAAACNDKLVTCTTLLEAGVPAAATWTPAALPPSARLPLFVKPRVGRGSVGAFTARTARELEFFLSYVSDPVAQEFLPGPEFTIDVLCDFRGRPLAVVPRERVVIRAGVIDRGRTRHDPVLLGLGLRCAEVFAFAGAINIQCRVTADGPRVFEINPRFSGGIPLTIRAGADFPRMLIDLTLGRPVQPAVGAFMGDLWMTSYEASIFLDERRAAVLPRRPTRLEEVA